MIMANLTGGLLCRTCAKLMRTPLIPQSERNILSLSYAVRKQSTEEKIETPKPGGLHQSYPTHIEELVESISRLNLLEVSSLNQLLKERLNIADTPMMPMGGVVAASPASSQDKLEPKEEQTEFSVKLVKFDEAKKVKLIKEIKTVMTDMNLVQAKKFVESFPQVVKDKIPKAEADKLKSQLELVGANVEIE